ncbi:hypothetical protein P9847_18695 [Paenibacillus chibensis]|uniref:Uncharacterized protein n=1 Tax=Paenibacillus chibensis TaxID=59846 RepID=A0ABU6PWS8_9BACL|nr:hypothetical protein [Paenibacillus chibensis]
MSRYPWRDTSEDIAGQSGSQWETPGGAQVKADKAQENAESYTDEKLGLHVGKGGVAQHAIANVTTGEAGFIDAKMYEKVVNLDPSLDGSVATPSKKGLMSKEDKQILDAASPEVTGGAIVKRTATGTFKAASPVNPTDVARKAEVDDVQKGLTDHKNNADVHLKTGDRLKLDTLKEGAEPNQLAFSKVNTISAKSKTDTVLLKNGVGITISDNPNTNEITITATGEAAPGPHAETHLDGGSDPIPNATETHSGLMAPTDKAKLNGIDEYANNYQHPPTHPATMIVEDEEHRFVSDAKLAELEAKESVAGAQEKADAAEIAAEEYTDRMAVTPLNEHAGNWTMHEAQAEVAASQTIIMVNAPGVSDPPPDGMRVTIYAKGDAGANPKIKFSSEGTQYPLLVKKAGDPVVMKTGLIYSFVKQGTDFLLASGSGSASTTGTVLDYPYLETVEPLIVSPLSHNLTGAANAVSSKKLVHVINSGVDDTATYTPTGLNFPYNAGPSFVSFDRTGDTMVLDNGGSTFDKVYVMKFDRAAQTYTLKQTIDIATQAASSGRTLEITRDGRWIFVGISASPYLVAFKNDGTGNYVRDTNIVPSSVVTDIGRYFTSMRICYQNQYHDDMFMVVGNGYMGSASYLGGIRYNGTTSTTFGSQATSNTIAGSEFQYSANTNMLYFKVSQTLYCTKINFSNATFSNFEQIDPSSISGGVYSFKLDSDGSVLYVSHAYSTKHRLTRFILNKDGLAISGTNDFSTQMLRESTVQYGNITNADSAYVYGLPYITTGGLEPKSMFRVKTNQSGGYDTPGSYQMAQISSASNSTPKGMWVSPMGNFIFFSYLTTDTAAQFIPYRTKLFAIEFNNANFERQPALIEQAIGYVETGFAYPSTGKVKIIQQSSKGAKTWR